MKTVSSVLFLITLFVLSSALNAGIRKYSGEFMSINVSARAQAMGGAFSAVSNDVWSGFYNPAGLMQLREAQIGFTHTQQFISSINHDYIGFAKPLSNNRAIGISMIRLGVDNIPDSRAAGIFIENAGGELELVGIDESQLSSFNSADYMLTFSVGQQFSENLLVGISAKLIRRDLADHSANGVGLDAGIVYRFNDRWQLGTSIRNITTTMIAWDTGETELVSPLAAMGTAYDIPIPMMNSRLTASLDLVAQTDNPVNLAEGSLESGLLGGAFGGELAVMERLFLRSGYDELQRLNFGIGIQIPHLRVDYALTRFSEEIGDAQRISILVDFGE